jgi:type I restriction enzyme S subunit
MSRYPKRPLGDAIRLDLDEVLVSPTSFYEVSGVYSFGRGLFARGKMQGSETSYAKLNTLHAGSIVLSRLKAFEGAISLIGKEFDGSFLSPEFPTFMVSADSDHRYIGFLCQWPVFWASLSKGSKGLGARRERVSVERLLGISVPLPTRGEQRRVADRLDSVLGRVGSVWELRARLFRLQDSLHESLVGRSLKNADESVRLGDVLAFERTPIAIDADSVYRTVGVRSFGKGLIHHSPAKGEDLSKLSYFQFRAGALALSNLMAWEGGIAVTTQEDTRYIASNRFFFYLPTGDRVNASYLRYFLLSRRGQALVGSACSAGAERNRTLGRKRFEALEIPLPPRAEQDRVARILDSLAERLRKAHTDPALDALRPAILNAAFTGQL